jgi:hypothetical protein
MLVKKQIKKQVMILPPGRTWALASSLIGHGHTDSRVRTPNYTFLCLSHFLPFSSRNHTPQNATQGKFFVIMLFLERYSLKLFRLSLSTEKTR